MPKKERTLIVIVKRPDGYLIQVDCKLQAAWRKHRKKWKRRWKPLLAFLLLLAGSAVAPATKTLLERVMRFLGGAGGINP
jgi:hypothetical protein